MLFKTPYDFLSLKSPCLLLGPLNYLYPSAEVAWLAHFAPTQELLLLLSVTPEEERTQLIVNSGIVYAAEQFPEKVWYEYAYKVLLQKYEKAIYAKQLLSLVPAQIQHIRYYGLNPMTKFWYDNVKGEPPRDGALRVLTNQIRSELLRKYTAPLMEWTDIGKFIRAHNLAP